MRPSSHQLQPESDEDQVSRRLSFESVEISIESRTNSYKLPSFRSFSSNSSISSVPDCPNSNSSSDSDSEENRLIAACAFRRYVELAQHGLTPAEATDVTVACTSSNRQYTPPSNGLLPAETIGVAAANNQHIDPTGQDLMAHLVNEAEVQELMAHLLHSVDVHDVVAGLVTDVESEKQRQRDAENEKKDTDAVGVGDMASPNDSDMKPSKDMTAIAHSADNQKDTDAVGVGDTASPNDADIKPSKDTTVIVQSADSALIAKAEPKAVRNKSKKQQKGKATHINPFMVRPYSFRGVLPVTMEQLNDEENAALAILNKSKVETAMHEWNVGDEAEATYDGRIYNVALTEVVEREDDCGKVRKCFLADWFNKRDTLNAAKFPLFPEQLRLPITQSVALPDFGKTRHNRIKAISGASSWNIGKRFVAADSKVHTLQLNDTTLKLITDTDNLTFSYTRIVSPSDKPTLQSFLKNKQRHAKPEESPLRTNKCSLPNLSQGVRHVVASSPSNAGTPGDAFSDTVVSCSIGAFEDRTDRRSPSPSPAVVQNLSKHEMTHATKVTEVENKYIDHLLTLLQKPPLKDEVCQTESRGVDKEANTYPQQFSMDIPPHAEHLSLVLVLENDSLEVFVPTDGDVDTEGGVNAGLTSTTDALTGQDGDDSGCEENQGLVLCMQQPSKVSNIGETSEKSGGQLEAIASVLCEGHPSGDLGREENQGHNAQGLALCVQQPSKVIKIGFGETSEDSDCETKEERATNHDPVLTTAACDAAVDLDLWDTEFYTCSQLPMAQPGNGLQSLFGDDYAQSQSADSLETDQSDVEIVKEVYASHQRPSKRKREEDRPEPRVAEMTQTEILRVGRQVLCTMPSGAAPSKLSDFDLEPQHVEFGLAPPKEAGSDLGLQADFDLEPQADYCLEPQPDFGLEPQADFGLEPQADFGLEPQADFGLEPQAKKSKSTGAAGLKFGRNTSDQLSLPPTPIPLAFTNNETTPTKQEFDLPAQTPPQSLPKQDPDGLTCSEWTQPNKEQPFMFMRKKSGCNILKVHFRGGRVYVSTAAREKTAKVLGALDVTSLTQDISATHLKVVVNVLAKATRAFMGAIYNLNSHRVVLFQVSPKVDRSSRTVETLLGQQPPPLREALQHIQEVCGLEKKLGKANAIVALNTIIDRMQGNARAAKRRSHVSQPAQPKLA